MKRESSNTAGREFHPAPKMDRYYFVNTMFIILYGNQFVNHFDLQKFSGPVLFIKKFNELAEVGKRNHTFFDLLVYNKVEN